MTFLSPSRRPWVRLARFGLAVAWVASAAGCAETGIDPGEQPFGRRGEVRVEVRAPLARGEGELEQVVTWSSEGPWRSRERISYRGQPGDETVRESSRDATTLSRAYSAWVDLINDTPSVSLFDAALDPTLDPACAAHQSRVSVRISDATRGDSITWTRCGEGTLPTLVAEASGPDPSASRVIQAVALVRDFTVALQKGFTYAYTGSVPFATLDRGEQSGAQLSVPRLIQDPETFATFWAEHRGSAAPPPVVDFGSELVFVAAVGTRFEVGDSVEVRRILPVGVGTQVELVERRPGDFCTPASRSHVPFHVVVAPRVPLPVTFGAGEVDLRACG